jgi:ATP-dependent Clp protease ATP-binding subunit ClpC
MSKDLEELFEKANDFYYNNDYDNALKIFNEILEKDAKNFQSLQKIAQIELARGNLQKSAEYYEKYLEINTEDANVWNDVGNVYFDMPDFENAIRCYKKSIEVDQDYYWAYYNIGLAIEEKDPDNFTTREVAREWFEKAIKIKNNYHPALNEIGLYHLDKGDLDKAEEYFNLSIQGYREYKFPYYNLGKIYKERGKIDKAKEFLKKAIKCDHNYIGALNTLGIIYYDEGNYDAALFYYTRALEVDSNYKYALYNIGLVFDAIDYHKKAYEMYKKAIEVDPKYKPALEEMKRLENDYPKDIKKGEQLVEADLKSLSYKDKFKIDEIIDKEVIEFAQQSQDELYCEKFGRNITKLAKEGKLFEVLGRDKEIKSTMEVLYKIKKNNPILIGKAGVGKTAIVEGLAQKIVSGNVPDYFKKMEIIELNMGMLVAGTNYRGDFEKRLKRIIEELREKDNIIIFIDEIHTILGAGETEGSSLDAANILKPALSRGELHCIGATTTDEYHKFFKKDAALDRRFYSILVEELNKDATLDILVKLKPRLENHYKISINGDYLKTIVDLSDDEIRNKVFPDKAIDVIEKSFSRCALDGKKEVDKDTIKDIIGEMIGVKFVETQEDNGKRLLEMEKFLKERIYGQDEAIDKVSSQIRMTKQKLDLKPEQPDGIFLFAGPSGVGKTYLAKQISAFLFGTENKLLTLNMSEFTEPHSVSKLIGSPPGYIGYDTASFFASKITENPSCVLLLDEVEKAHPEVLKIFLQIFDDGKITDTKGQDIYFSNITIIMTSNVIGINNEGGIGFSEKEQKPDSQLSQFFPVEFVNRIDDIIIFNYINKDVALDILNNIIIKKSNKIFEKRGIEVSFNSTFMDHILEIGYSKKFGVRNLERVFEKEVMTAISRYLFEFPETKKLNITSENGRIKVQ